MSSNGLLRSTAEVGKGVFRMMPKLYDPAEVTSRLPND